MREKPVGLRLVLAHCAVLVASIASFATEPNYVKTTIYSSSTSSADAISYSDGLGRSIQSQTYLPDETKIISGTIYDDAGRVSKIIKPFNTTGTGYFTDDLETAASNYFDGSSDHRPSAGGKAYSETKYWEDPLGRVKEIGAPGQAFSANNKPVRSWYLATLDLTTRSYSFSYEDNAYTVNFIDGFISAVSLSSSALMNLSALQHNPEPDAKYFLSVTMDANGGFSQAISDVFGRTIKTWGSASEQPSNPTEANKIVASYEYDILGNVLKETPPGNALLAATEYKYNTLGQLDWIKTPDAGIKEYRYDNAGRQWLTKTALHKELSTLNGNKTEFFSTVSYDNFGRARKISEVCVPITTGSEILFTKVLLTESDFAENAKTRIWNIYDKIDDLDMLETIGLNWISDVKGTLQNLRGRLVASVSYDESYWDESYVGETKKNQIVVDVYSYDEEGRMKFRFKYIPGLKLQRFQYGYDLQGRLINEAYWKDFETTPVTITSQRTLSYDKLGRLVDVNNDLTNLSLVANDYSPTGLLSRKMYSEQADASPAFATEYFYNIRGWFKAMRTEGETPIFSEVLEYENPLAGHIAQFNGNIAQAGVTYCAAAGMTGDNNQLFNYHYDAASRLVKTNSMLDNKYSEVFKYDVAGRFVKKVEGSTDLSSSTEEYSYAPNSSRLEYISNHPTKSDIKNFVYDPNGNMVFDKSKKMVTEYDWRNLPVKFKFYATAQDLPWSELICQGLEKEGHKLVSEVRMAYDASGNRVLKTTYNKASTN